MKKLLLTLIVIAGIIGCSGEIKIESKPSEPTPQPRLVWHRHSAPGSGAWIGIIEDTENDVEYLCVSGTQCIAICPMVKQNVQAEEPNVKRNMD